MSWSEETEELRERYHASYGFTQGWWLASTAAYIVLPTGKIWQYLVLVALGVGTSVLFRRCWRKYRAAVRAETDKAVAEAREEMRLLTREEMRLLTEQLRGRLQ